MDTNNVKSLLEQYEGANTKWHEAKAAVDVAYRAQSDIVKQIAKEIAPKKQIVYKGRQLTIVCRKSKSGDGETYFFKGPKSDDAVEID